MRINKYLSERGVASRRGVDALIISGRVLINDRVASLGDQVSENDRVCVDGKTISRQARKHVYLAFNKPVGLICTTDPEARDSVISHIDYPERLFPVGRLDVASSGLLILTNDGDVVNRMLRKENRLEKEYVVRVDKGLTRDFLHDMSVGVDLGDAITLPAIVEKMGKNTFSIVLIQGLNRQIRRMCEVLGYKALKLRRVRIGKLTLGDLKFGSWKKISLKDVDERLVD